MVAARTAGSLRPNGRALLLGGLALVALAALVAAGVLYPRTTAAAARDDRRAAILHDARQNAVNFTTLDYRHLDRDLGRVLAGATGSFKKEFTAGSSDLRTLVTQNKAVSKGEVLEAGLVSSDSDSARVLVVADSQVTNTANPTPQARHYRIQMDLVRGASGRWLVADLSFVG